MEDIKKARKSLERKITLVIIINKEIAVFKVPRGADGRVNSFTPHLASILTDLGVVLFARYKYSHLSKDIHKLEDERAEIERQFLTLSPLDNTPKEPFHKFLWKFDLDYNEFIVKELNSRKLPAIKKADYNRLQKLARKWREASKDCHYSLSKQEKRHLKKRVAKCHHLL